jgi:Matrixin
MRAVFALTLHSRSVVGVGAVVITLWLGTTAGAAEAQIERACELPKSMRNPPDAMVRRVANDRRPSGTETTDFFGPHAYRVTKCDSDNRAVESELVDRIPVPGGTADVPMSTTVKRGDGYQTSDAVYGSASEPRWAAAWRRDHAKVEARLEPPTDPYAAAEKVDSPTVDPFQSGSSGGLSVPASPPPSGEGGNATSANGESAGDDQYAEPTFGGEATSGPPRDPHSSSRPGDELSPDPPPLPRLRKPPDDGAPRADAKRGDGLAHAADADGGYPAGGDASWVWAGTGCDQAEHWGFGSHPTHQTTYYINTGSWYPNGDVARAAIQAGANAWKWDINPCGIPWQKSFNFVYGYDTTQTAMDQPSGFNVIDFGYLSDLGWCPGALACTRSFGTGWGGISEFDIRFDKNFWWYLNDGTGPVNGQYDLISLAAHELGHAQGLAHSPNGPSLTMFGLFVPFNYLDSRALQARDLGLGDILGQQGLYGGVGW